MPYCEQHNEVYRGESCPICSGEQTPADEDGGGSDPDPAGSVEDAVEEALDGVVDGVGDSANDVVVGTQNKSVDDSSETYIDNSETVIDESETVHDDSATVTDSVVSRSSIEGNAEVEDSVVNRSEVAGGDSSRGEPGGPDKSERSKTSQPTGTGGAREPTRHSEASTDRNRSPQSGRETPPAEETEPEPTGQASGQTADTKHCPYCGEEIPRQAKFCKHCGEEI